VFFCWVCDPFPGRPDVSGGACFLVVEVLVDQGTHAKSYIKSILLLHWPKNLEAGMSWPTMTDALSFLWRKLCRKQECERVKALYDELRKCKFRVIESGDAVCTWNWLLNGLEIQIKCQPSTFFSIPNAYEKIGKAHRQGWFPRTEIRTSPWVGVW